MRQGNLEKSIEWAKVFKRASSKYKQPITLLRQLMLNLEVQEILGVGSDEREQLDVVELRRAHDLMDELVDKVANQYRSSQP